LYVKTAVRAAAVFRVPFVLVFFIQTFRLSRAGGRIVPEDATEGYSLKRLDRADFEARGRKGKGSSVKGREAEEGGEVTSDQ
jgi:hypothetical protein